LDLSRCWLVPWDQYPTDPWDLLVRFHLLDLILCSLVR